MGTVIDVTTDQLLAQRRELLARAGTSWERLVELADAFALEAEERNIFDSIRAIDYLLAGDDAD